MTSAGLSVGRVAGEVRRGKASHGPVDNFELKRWRCLDATEVLGRICTYAKRDPTFTPRSCLQTTRWHCSVEGAEYELLCNGAKFYDTRAGIGGGGAVDLAMHLKQLAFKPAARLLRSLGL